MSQPLQITLLAENTAVGQGVKGEHGLAFHIVLGERRILFDTGQGLVTTDNATVLNVDLTALDAVVLSHGHYDHTGGLAQVLAQTLQPLTVYAHPAALEPKYRAAPSGIRSIGMPDDCREALENQKDRLVLSTESTEVAPGIRTTGEIPRRYDVERSNEHFCLDAQGQQADPIADDQSLIIETETGNVVLLGCAHAGLINTLEHICELTHGAPLRAVVGGMHLRSVSNERLAWTIRELKRYDVIWLSPMHCTGFTAAAALSQAFPEKFRWAGAGTILTF